MGISAERLFWVDVEDREDGRATVLYVGTTNVTDMPTWAEGRDGTPHGVYAFGSPRNSGYMPDGDATP